jgi:hypothetical protein
MFFLPTELKAKFSPTFQCEQPVLEELSEIFGCFDHLNRPKKGGILPEILRFSCVLRWFPFFQRYDVDTEASGHPASGSAGVRGAQHAAPCPGGVFLLSCIHKSSVASFFVLFFLFMVTQQRTASLQTVGLKMTRHTFPDNALGD